MGKAYRRSAEGKRSMNIRFATCMLIAMIVRGIAITTTPLRAAEPTTPVVEQTSLTHPEQWQIAAIDAVARNGQSGVPRMR